MKKNRKEHNYRNNFKKQVSKDKKKIEKNINGIFRENTED